MRKVFGYQEYWYRCAPEATTGEAPLQYVSRGRDQGSGQWLEEEEGGTNGRAADSVIRGGESKSSQIQQADWFVCERPKS